MKFELPKGATCWPDWIDKVELLDFDEAVALTKLGLDVHREPCLFNKWGSWDMVEVHPLFMRYCPQCSQHELSHCIFFLVK